MSNLKIKPWGVEGHWSPVSHPMYLSLYTRATLSRHGHTPIIQEYNLTYGYWATARNMSKKEVVFLFGNGYVGQHDS